MRIEQTCTPQEPKPVRNFAWAHGRIFRDTFSPSGHIFTIIRSGPDRYHWVDLTDGIVCEDSTPGSSEWVSTYVELPNARLVLE